MNRRQEERNRACTNRGTKQEQRPLADYALQGRGGEANCLSAEERNKRSAVKKLFLTMLGAALIAAPTALRAQDFGGVGVTAEKVDVQKLKSAVTKANTDATDAKKGAKAATWIKLGDVLLDVDGKPTNGLFAGMDETMLKLTHGDAAPERVDVGGKQFDVYTYEHFKAYVSNGKVEFFLPTTVIDPRALDKAYDAFAKAYELDAKAAVKKAATGMENIRIKSFENGGTHYALGEYKIGADNFRRAYRASAHPSLNSIDTMSLYYAGMSGIFGEDYSTALTDLDKALEMGYESGGETYRLKFLGLYSLDEKEKALEALKYGLSRYPSNEDLIDMMMRYYAENDGDPTSMIPMVENAIAQNPNNASLYQGLARVYDKLGQQDNAIEAIQKAVAITPDDFLSNYLEGFFIIKKGDAMDEEMRNMTITSRAQAQEARAAVNEAFAKALAPLEKAYSIDPSESATVELLKNLTFRLREDPAMNEKYEKYDALFRSVSE